ncbi:hypothetical protein F6X38_04880 [Aureimonas leprariae]|uniref:Isoprenylcysteine carboxyl methyltransferase n=1 Tax=Plantimonas leprariae TaxID=2615207 RepID=A0A7V7TXV6_9HYPH|nr:hypothetical protein F6X38_04880 [Aureimonas leprariae]
MFRLLTLAISFRHEKALRAGGAVEHGAANTRLLALTHVAYYVAGFAEGLFRAPRFDAVSGLGLALYLFGAAMLFVVIALLGRFWTVRIMIAPDHVAVTHPLFRVLRHPNYYLNILPELVGYALVMHAFATLVIGMAIYAVPLVRRIREEERVMRADVPGYT